MKRLYKKLLILGIAAALIIIVITSSSIKANLDNLNAMFNMNNNKLCLIGGGEKSKSFENYWGGFSLNTAMKITKTAEKRGIHATIEGTIYQPNVRVKPNEIIQSNVITTDCNFLEATGSKLVKGRFFSTKEFKNFSMVCVISEDLEKTIGNKNYIFIKNQKIKVIGVLHVADKVTGLFSITGGMYNAVPLNRNIFLPISTASKQLVYSTDSKITFNDYSGINLFIVNNSMNYSKSQLINILKKPFNNDLVKVKLESFIASDIKKYIYRSAINSAILLLALSLSAIFLAGVNIIFISSANVISIKKQIGLKMALGAKRKAVIKEVFFEIFICILKGAYIGIALASLLCVIINNLIGELEYNIDIYTFIVSAAAVLLLSIIATIIPVCKLIKMDPITALRERD
jgi:ABC-type antimicrobial peptide transport system permease subunit